MGGENQWGKEGEGAWSAWGLVRSALRWSDATVSPTSGGWSPIGFAAARGQRGPASSSPCARWPSSLRRAPPPAPVTGRRAGWSQRPLPESERNEKHGSCKNIFVRHICTQLNKTKQLLVKSTGKNRSDWRTTSSTTNYHSIKQTPRLSVDADGGLMSQRVSVSGKQGSGCAPVRVCVFVFMCLCV